MIMYSVHYAFQMFRFFEVGFLYNNVVNVAYLSGKIKRSLHEIVGLKDEHIVDRATCITKRPGSTALQRYSERVTGLAATKGYISGKIRLWV